MCVGFLYTVATKVLLGPGETGVSRKGEAPSLLESSVVNCMCGSSEVICWSVC